MEIQGHDQVIENIHNDVFNGAIYREVDRVIFQPEQDAGTEIEDEDIRIPGDDPDDDFGTDIDCHMPQMPCAIDSPLTGILGLSSEKFEEKKMKAGFCQICKKQYAHLSIHISRVHKGTRKKYTCATCGKIYNTKAGLNYHMESHAKEKPNKCPECGKGFCLEANVKFHVHNTHRKRPTLCPFCGKCLYSAYSLKRHLRMHSGKRPFKCEVCGLTFAYRNVLRDHKLIHSGERPFRCDICKREFRQHSTLTQHVKYVHNGVKNIKCEKCDLKFARPSYLRQHVMRAHCTNPKRFGPCTTCGKHFSNVRSLRRHAESRCNKTHTCEACKRRFSWTTSLQKHMELYEGQKPFMCGYCEKSFHLKRYAIDECKGNNNEAELQIEIITDEGDLSENEDFESADHRKLSFLRIEVIDDVEYQPEDDSFCDSTLQSLDREVPDEYLNTTGHVHGTSSHDNHSDDIFNLVSLPQVTKIQPFEVKAAGDRESEELANITPSESESTNSLQSHVYVPLSDDFSDEYLSPAKHTTSITKIQEGVDTVSHLSRARDDRPVWVCDVCGKATVNMQVHLKLFCRKNEALVECKVCKKVVRKTRMKYHMRTHEERQFSCDICARKFISKSALNSHLKTHGEEKPFECEICHKSFRIEETLKKHIRTHTGERPYPCRICGQRFGHLKVRSDHEKIHTGEKPHVCDVCGKAFRQRSTLRSHWATHSNDKQFRCEICGKKFSRKNDLQQHVKRHNKEREKFRCQQCGNEYSEHYSLLKHLRWHEKLACQTCNRRFSTQEELEKHEKKFEGKQPFSCGQCDKKYHLKQSLLRHMAEHTGNGKITHK